MAPNSGMGIEGIRTELGPSCLLGSITSRCSGKLSPRSSPEGKVLLGEERRPERAAEIEPKDRLEWKEPVAALCATLCATYKG